MTEDNSNLAISLFSEILTVDQLFRDRMAKILPKGMELSHFAVLHQLANINAERTPAQLAKSFHVTRGAMTNTLTKLELAGYIHIRPDWEDARRKLVALSYAGHEARNNALASVSPVISALIEDISAQKVKSILPALRDLRQKLEAHLIKQGRYINKKGNSVVTNFVAINHMNYLFNDLKDNQI